jgi:glycosyltransferase involved in cell wall biosynthesis
MCLAKPVIVSSHVGCAEDLVQPRVNGLVFPAGDVAALADSLRELLAEPARLHPMGASSKERIAHYSYRQATAGLREALAELDRRRPNAALSEQSPRMLLS